MIYYYIFTSIFYFLSFREDDKTNMESSENKEESINEEKSSNISRNKHGKSMKKSSIHDRNMLGDILFGKTNKAYISENIGKSRTQKKHKTFNSASKRKEKGYLY